jgi:hypothetical protein
MRLAEKWFLLVMLIIAPARADMVTLFTSGTFGPGAPAGLLTAPNAPWSFSFTTDLQPTGFQAGNEFVPSNLYDVSYILNGVLIAVNSNDVGFGQAASDYVSATFNYFDGNTLVLALLSFDVPTPFFTGTISDPTGVCHCLMPTLIPGSYAISDGAIHDTKSNSFTSMNAGTLTITEVASVPEASSFLLMAVGAGFLAGTRGISARRSGAARTGTTSDATHPT